MANLADRHHRMRRLGHRRAVLAVDLPAAGQAADAFRRHVGAGKHRRHAGRFRCGAGINTVDFRMRPIRPFHIRIQLSWAVDIVGVMAAAVEKARVFLSANGCTDPFEGHGVISLFWRLCFAVHQRMRGRDRFYNVMITGAAAQIALQAVTDFLLRDAGRDGCSPGRSRTSPCRAYRSRIAKRDARETFPASDAACRRPRQGPRWSATLVPAACTANIVHDLAEMPSTCTTQAPHCDVSQPTWVPVSASFSRNSSTSRVRFSTSTVCCFPFTVRVT